MEVLVAVAIPQTQVVAAAAAVTREMAERVLRQHQVTAATGPVVVVVVALEVQVRLEPVVALDFIRVLTDQEQHRPVLVRASRVALDQH